MDSSALWFSSTLLTVKLVTALWAGQLGLIALTYGRSIIGRQFLLAAASMALAINAWRTSNSKDSSDLAIFSPASLWLVAALLAAALTIDCLRRWLVAGEPSQTVVDANTVTADPKTNKNAAVARRERFSTSAFILTLLGLGVSLAAVLKTPSGQVYSATAQWLASCETLCVMLMFGATIPATLELTIGRTGRALLQQAWIGLSLAAGLALLSQMCLSVAVMYRVRATETPEEAVMPILFATGLAIVAYIVWAIPARMAAQARRGQLNEQVSLAMAAWLALICLLLTIALPHAWPWTRLPQSL